MIDWMWILTVVVPIALMTWVKIKFLGFYEDNESETDLDWGITDDFAVSSAETGPIVYYAANGYGIGDREYRFNYKKVGGSWRAYILKMPSLRGRAGDGHSTHRLWDGDKPYICWDRSVNSLNDMQSISRVWADSVQEYIATGKRFG